MRTGAASARSAERHRDAPAGAAPQGCRRGHRSGAGWVRTDIRQAGVRVSGADRHAVGWCVAHTGPRSTRRTMCEPCRRCGRRSASIVFRCVAGRWRSSTRRRRLATAVSSCSRCRAGGRSPCRRFPKCPSTDRCQSHGIGIQASIDWQSASRQKVGTFSGASGQDGQAASRLSRSWAAVLVSWRQTRRWTKAPSRSNGLTGGEQVGCK